MTLEFDPKCGTAQIEDSLQLYVPSRAQAPGWGRSMEATGQVDRAQWWPVLHKFHGSFPGNWPSMAVILPGRHSILITEHTIDSQVSIPLLLGNLFIKFHIYLSGNEVCFSLETASDYVKDDKACFYGFKCTVVGYRWTTKAEEVNILTSVSEVWSKTGARLTLCVAGSQVAGVWHELSRGHVCSISHEEGHPVACGLARGG